MILNEQAYFFIRADQHNKYRAVLTPDNDVLPLAKVPNAIQVYPTSAGAIPGYEDVIMICCIIGPEFQEDLKDIAETDDWASLETVVCVDLAGKYAGRDLSYTERWGVFENHPALDGQVQVGIDPETGDSLFVDIVDRVQWP